MKKRMVVAATATAVVGLGVSVTAASAADWLYYSVNSGGTKLGRVQLDGTTDRNDAFASFTENIAGLAATDSAAYVVTQQNQSNNKTLWKVDSSGNKTNLLGSLMCSTVSGASAYGLATDGQHLYYICENGTNPQASTRYLARVGLDGSSRNETFSGALTGIHTTSSILTVGDGYAYFRGGPSSGFGADRLYRLPLTAGATATQATSTDSAQEIAWSPAGLFSMDNPSGPTRSLSRFVPSAFPGWTATTVFSSLSTSMTPILAANTTNLYWAVGMMGSALAKASVDGGTPNTTFLTLSGMASFGGYVAVAPSGPGRDGLFRDIHRTQIATSRHAHIAARHEHAVAGENRNQERLRCSGRDLVGASPFQTAGQLAHTHR